MMKQIILIFIFLTGVMIGSSSKPGCQISLSCRLLKKQDQTFMLVVSREHIQDTIFNVQKIGTLKISEYGSCWVYVWGNYTKDKNGRRPHTKTGWIHVCDGGDIKVTIHGIYDEKDGSFHGRKNAVIYTVDEARKKLCK